jgi:hypothetical protein
LLASEQRFQLSVFSFQQALGQGFGAGVNRWRRLRGRASGRFAGKPAPTADFGLRRQVRVWELACKGKAGFSGFSFQRALGRGFVPVLIGGWRIPVAVVSAGSPASRLPQPISGFAARFGCGSLLASEQRIRFSVFSFQQALGHRLLPVVVGGDGFT